MNFKKLFYCSDFMKDYKLFIFVLMVLMLVCSVSVVSAEDSLNETLSVDDSDDFIGDSDSTVYVDGNFSGDE